MRAIKAGDKVRGAYYGNAFAGTVRNVRWHTIDRDTREVWVTFDSPTEMTIGNAASVRTECLCYVDFEGGDQWAEGSTWVEVVA
jgi:SLT domain-containing protein